MNSSSSPEKEAQDKKANGRWTKEEHQKFLEALKKFGKNWKQVEEYIGTRNGAQIRSHAQKFFNRLEKEYQLQNGTSQNAVVEQPKGKSMRKFSGCSISTNNSDRIEINPEDFSLLGYSTNPQFSKPKDINEETKVDIQSMPHSPKTDHFEQPVEIIKRPPRKMSEDVLVLGARNQNPFDIMM